MGVDTLHVFPETREVAAEVESAYGKKIAWFKPAGLNTYEEFVASAADNAVAAALNASCVQNSRDRLT